MSIDAPSAPPLLRTADRRSRNRRQRLDDVAGDAATVEDDLAEQVSANEALTKRLEKQRKTVGALEDRVRELGGDPAD